MTARIIDGNQVAAGVRAAVAERAAAFAARYGFPPGLGVVLVGDNPASAQYVRMKRRACEQVGITSIARVLPQSAAHDEVASAVHELNADPAVHGILVQLPLPPQVNEESILRLVSIDKDVDGFHPENLGRLGMKGREPLFTPATPTGCMKLLETVGTPLDGATAVVIGRSNIVGLPVALMLMKANATVTVCHSRTREIASVVRGADIVIAAIGRPHYVQADWLKPGAVVIDVGTNRIDDAADPRGYRYVGDVDFDAAVHVVGAITQVPGGVGPMTIAMLLDNTMKAAARLADVSATI
jgi:5,10-methylene-tetrahydrofolate dehydrogenase/methenyl tetrahydrofolate cyclohydrolase